MKVDLGHNKISLAFVIFLDLELDTVVNILGNKISPRPHQPQTTPALHIRVEVGSVGFSMLNSPRAYGCGVIVNPTSSKDGIFLRPKVSTCPTKSIWAPLS